jgi:hypothetical protein
MPPNFSALWAAQRAKAWPTAVIAMDRFRSSLAHGSILIALGPSGKVRRLMVAQPARDNLPMLLPASHSIFASAAEPHILIYAVSELVLKFISPGWGTF